eukprot:CAMPEP_0171612082 /NCGR_PEP_ID=MMETSP0990-20121206/10999_1 /TAXON_ID=483369 /ORGANISM="non described non described, Strain CCMP2098" /LENGTH=153 /DNA_ID=CAMNT_0012175747 /DNA_START=324 /DNA_END=782 /DNA_ORIENTATION=+
MEGLPRHSCHAIVYSDQEVTVFGRLHSSPPSQVQDSFEHIVHDYSIFAITFLVDTPEEDSSLRAVVAFGYLLVSDVLVLEHFVEVGPRLPHGHESELRDLVLFGVLDFAQHLVNAGAHSVGGEKRALPNEVHDPSHVYRVLRLRDAVDLANYA